MTDTPDLRALVTGASSGIAPPMPVASEGLDRGKVRVVAGWPNRVLGFVVQRLAPRGLARRVAGELYRPRKGKKDSRNDDLAVALDFRNRFPA
jgi:hypothetical protein